MALSFKEDGPACLSRFPPLPLRLSSPTLRRRPRESLRSSRTLLHFRVHVGLKCWVGGWREGRREVRRSWEPELAATPQAGRHDEVRVGSGSYWESNISKSCRV